MRRIVAVLSVVLSAGLLFGCGDNMNSVSPTQPTSSTPTPSTSPARLSFTVSGVVTESGSSQPVADVAVEWEDAMADAPMWRGTRTDSNGAYQMAVTQGIPSIALRARKSGYVDQTVTISVQADSTVNFVLGKMGPWDY